MGNVPQQEGRVNEADYMVYIVADDPFNEMLRAAGLGPNTEDEGDHQYHEADDQPRNPYRLDRRQEGEEMAQGQTARYDPGSGWCWHFDCHKCPGWTSIGACEREMCWQSELGEEALDMAFCEETDTAEGAGGRA